MTQRSGHRFEARSSGASERSHCAPTAIQQKINADFKPDKLTAFLEEIRCRSQFHYWLFGHYHDNRIIGEKYVMLYEQMVRVL